MEVEIASLNAYGMSSSSRTADSVLFSEGIFIKPNDWVLHMNQVEAVGVLLIGGGLISGSIATTQGFQRVVLPSVFLIGFGIVVTGFGTYR